MKAQRDRFGIHEAAICTTLKASLCSRPIARADKPRVFHFDVAQLTQYSVQWANGGALYDRTLSALA